VWQKSSRNVGNRQPGAVSSTLRFKHRQLFLGPTLLQETVGMEETDDGIWAIYSYDVLLARLDERDFKLRG
jgi:hypothetical protein